MKKIHLSRRNTDTDQELVEIVCERYNAANETNIQPKDVTIAWPTHRDLVRDEKEGKHLIGTIKGTSSSFTSGLYA